MLYAYAKSNKIYINDLKGWWLVLFSLTSCLQCVGSSNYCPEQNRLVVSSTFSIMSAITFSLYIIHFVTNVCIRNMVFDYVGTYSFSFYLFHIYFLRFTNNINIIIYCMLVIVCSTVLVYNNFNSKIKHLEK